MARNAFKMKTPHQRSGQKSNHQDSFHSEGVLDFMYGFCRQLGLQTGDCISRAGRRIVRISTGTWRRIKPAVQACVKACAWLGTTGVHTIAAPFIHVVQDTASIAEEVRQEGPDSVWQAGKLFVKKEFVVHRQGLKGFTNYVAPVAAVLTVVIVAQYAVGTASWISASEQEGVAPVMFRMAVEEYEPGVPELADVRMSLVAPEATSSTPEAEDTQEEYQLVNSMVKMPSSDIIEATGVYVDGEFRGAVEDVTAIKNYMKTVLARYQKDVTDGTVEFVNEIDFAEGLFPASALVDADQIVSLFASEVSGRKEYITQEGDTPLGIADKMDVPYRELKALNPGIEKALFVGQKVLVANSVSFLRVKVVKTENYQEAIPYDTETVEDSSKLKYVETVLREGVEGIADVTARVEYIDGVEVSRTILSSEVVQEPVSAKVSIGTKEPTSIYITGGKVYGGNFLWPVGGTGGYISSWYGDGRNHKGLDIAAPAGTPIYAAADGVVTISRSNYWGYGKCVIIQHSNGLETVYGHASQLYVTEGQRVAQGDVIAAVGSTGQSTGNHCHFEIRQNGVCLNPAPYLGQ
ncbi:MAG TPA: M23 family metallopeptidase [Firmicutes bacterium]|nr:M23 family metallopeptidase [Bacillota bacterium]